MPAQKKGVITNNLQPVKSKQVYSINGKEMPVYYFPAGGVINADDYILYNVKPEINGKSAVLRKQDFMPNGFLHDAHINLVNKLTGNLVDTFTPTYGYNVQKTFGRFYFVSSSVYITTPDGWVMAIDDSNRDFFYEQSLSVSVATGITPNPHLRINLGQTSNSDEKGIILTVSSLATTFKIDLAQLSYKSFHIMLESPGDMITFSLLRADNEIEPSLLIESIDLYSTILPDVGPVLEQ